MKLFGSRFHTVLIAAAIASMPLGAMAATMNFNADLSAPSGVDSKGTGSLTATLDTDTHMFSYNITYSGLSGSATAAHFHGPAAAGANARPEFAIKSLDSPISGMATLTPAQEKDLEGGMLYVNIHTAANKGGEIRGQVEPAK